MAKVLVCDDDREIVEAIAIYLESAGYEVVKAANGREALDILETEEVQLVIMDIMMPVMDGIRATRELRGKSRVPVILLSAKSEDEDKILGLDIGADDYVTKPFSPLELLARVRSQIRRYTKLGSSETEEKNRIVIGGLVIDDNEKTVSVDGEPVRLTPIEYDILLLLSRNPGRVYTTSQIYEAVWKEDALGADNVIAVHIRHIREKIEIDPKDPRYLKVVWGQGYKMEKQK